MIKVWRWIKRWWWTFVAGAAAVAGFFFWLLVPRSKRDTVPDRIPPKTFKERAQENVERVRLEGEVEKARVKATAGSQRRQIDVIEAMGKKDPVMARKQLASWLARNL